MMSNASVANGDLSFVEAPPLRVLIVEDSPAQQAALTRILEGAPRRCEVVAADNGVMALRLLRNGRFDIAFVDIHLPGMEGDVLVEVARDMETMPFYVVVSAADDPDIVDRMRRLDAYDFIRKPYSPADILRTLRVLEFNPEQHTGLVVGRSRTECRLVSKIITRSHFRMRLFEATDGVEAFETLVREKPDFVFLDVDLKGVTAAQTYRILRAHDPYLRVVWIGNPARVQAAAGATPVDLVLSKPFHPYDVNSLMHRLLGMSAPFSHA